MRCKEDIDNIGTDITPTLTPLSFSLHNSLLHTHCSSCFSPIPHPHNNPNINPPLYCSPHCSAAHSPIHLSSAERHLSPSADSSLLRTALRLLLRPNRPSSPGRFSHLLSNRHLLTCQNDDVSHSVSANASAMAHAIAKQHCSPEPYDDAGLEDATAALCAVLTNAVEVHDSEGCALGIAVFEPAFSWINHSCSPNACYRFAFSSSLPSQEAKFLIAPFTRHSQQQPQVLFFFNFFIYFFYYFYVIFWFCCFVKVGIVFCR